jgi:hypothetical protein
MRSAASISMCIRARRREADLDVIRPA